MPKRPAEPRKIPTKQALAPLDSSLCRAHGLGWRSCWILSEMTFPGAAGERVQWCSDLKLTLFSSLHHTIAIRFGNSTVHGGGLQSMPRRGGQRPGVGTIVPPTGPRTPRVAAAPIWSAWEAGAKRPTSLWQGVLQTLLNATAAPTTKHQRRPATPHAASPPCRRHGTHTCTRDATRACSQGSTVQRTPAATGVVWRVSALAPA